MKTNILTVVILSTLFISTSLFSQDSINLEENEQLPTTEVVLDSSVVNNNADTQEIEEIIEDTKEQPSPYDYNQLFMFGFLVLGAILVVWKFSGKGKY